MAQQSIPYRILIGPFTDNPLYNNPLLLGDYADHPQIRYLVTSSELARPQDVVLGLPQDSWAMILAHLPQDWQPDVIIWWDLIFQGMPVGIGACPCPVLAVVCDWNLGWETTVAYSHVLDGVLGDRALVQTLQQVGIANALYFPSYSFNPHQHHGDVDGERPYDVTFVGNLSPYVQVHRSHYLSRLADLSDQYRVTIQGGVFGPAYARLLAQSRIVFNHSVRGEMNMRAYEAPACGALLFMEETNLEIRDFLTDGESCVLYNAHNLEEKIHYYLAHEDERCRIARCGQEKIQAWSYTTHFETLLALLPRFLDLPRSRPRPHGEITVAERLRSARQLCQTTTPGAYQASLLSLEPALFQTDAVELAGLAPEILNALAVLLVSDAQAAVAWPRAEQILYLALQQEPEAVILHYNLAFIKTLQGDSAAALVAWRQCLTLLPLAPEPVRWQGFLLPLRFDAAFRIAWEKAMVPAQTRHMDWQSLLVGQCWFQIGQLLQVAQPMEAVQAYQQSLKNWLTHGDAWFYLGETYALLRVSEPVRMAFQHAVSLVPLKMHWWPVMLENLIDLALFEQPLEQRENLVTAWALAQTWLRQLKAFGTELAPLKTYVQALFQWLDLQYQIMVRAEMTGQQLVQALQGPWPIPLFAKFCDWLQGELLPQVAWLWPILDPIVVYWPTESIEPWPDVPVDWGFFRGGVPQVANWQVSWSHIAPTEGCWQRIYGAMKQPFQLDAVLLPPWFPDIDPSELPALLPAPHSWRVLVVATGLAMPALAELIQDCLARQDDTTEWLVWWSSGPPTEADWAQLESLLPTGDLPVTFWPDTATVAEIKMLLHGVQAIVAQPSDASHYWMWWGLALGHLVCPWADASAWWELTQQVYGVVPAQQPLSLKDTASPLHHIWQKTTDSRQAYQQALQQWRQEKATEKWLNGLWTFKLRHLFG